LVGKSPLITVGRLLLIGAEISRYGLDSTGLEEGIMAGILKRIRQISSHKSADFLTSSTTISQAFKFFFRKQATWVNIRSIGL
jgi:hypothetical protein